MVTCKKPLFLRGEQRLCSFSCQHLAECISVRDGKARGSRHNQPFIWIGMRGLQMETVHTRPGEKKECFRRERGALKKSTGEIMRKPHDRSIVVCSIFPLSIATFFKLSGVARTIHPWKEYRKGGKEKESGYPFSPSVHAGREMRMVLSPFLCGGSTQASISVKTNPFPI